jgi:PEGA domain-containing protein/SmpA/OmlA family protein
MPRNLLRQISSHTLASTSAKISGTLFAMIRKEMFSLACFMGFALLTAFAQDPGQRPMLEDSIQARYRLTILGGGPLGIRGGDNSIRRVGGIVVLQQDGFFGSLSRSTLTANAIHEGQLNILTGAKDVPLARGEKFYVTSVYVGSDLVTLGLLSTRVMPGPKKATQAWATANFFFSPETLAQGDLQKVYSVIDQWILPEGAGSPPAPPTAVAASAPPAPVVNSSAPASRVSKISNSSTLELKPGMSRDEVVSALGTPLQEVTFGDHRWLTYPGITISLEQGKVTSADRNAQALAPVRISSDPTGADVLLDGSFVSSTPAVLRLQSGTYKITVKMSGYADWEREVKILPGAEVSLEAKLSK